MDEAIPNINQSDVRSDELQDILEMVRDMMGELHHTASLSAELNEINVTDEWAESIKETLRTPVVSSFDALRSLEKSIVEMLQEQFFEFINSKSHLIERVFLVSKNKLHYAVVLKDDTIENEAEILEFKSSYDDTPVANKFPLIISFPHLEHLEDARIDEEISLD